MMKDPCQCTGKTGFLTFDLAAKVAKRFFTRKRRKFVPNAMKSRQRPYRCRLCNKWHIG